MSALVTSSWPKPQPARDPTFCFLSLHPKQDVIFLFRLILIPCLLRLRRCRASPIGGLIEGDASCPELATRPR